MTDPIRDEWYPVALVSQLPKGDRDTLLLGEPIRITLQAGQPMVTASGRVLLSVSPHTRDPRRPVCRELATAPRDEAAPNAPDFILDAHERVAHVLPPEDVDMDVEGQLVA